MNKFLWKEFLVILATNTAVIFYINSSMMFGELSALTCAALSLAGSIFCYALLEKYISKDKSS